MTDGLWMRGFPYINLPILDLELDIVAARWLINTHTELPFLNQAAALEHHYSSQVARATSFTALIMLTEYTNLQTIKGVQDAVMHIIEDFMIPEMQTWVATQLKRVKSEQVAEFRCKEREAGWLPPTEIIEFTEYCKEVELLIYDFEEAGKPFGSPYHEVLKKLCGVEVNGSIDNGLQRNGVKYIPGTHDNNRISAHLICEFVQPTVVTKPKILNFRAWHRVDETGFPMEKFDIEENEDSSDDILESPIEFLSKADSGDHYLTFASHVKQVKEEFNYQDPVVQLAILQILIFGKLIPLPTVEAKKETILVWHAKTRKVKYR
ncbi:hypothetical protein BDZ91DRAFT_813856 [Kalaharituber pfeilii]|nr:hypothetical protein BDZ91DRAFT_813856 [Kalaharituber pfeilii]